jgi:hypothetical protein
VVTDGNSPKYFSLGDIPQVQTTLAGRQQNNDVILQFNCSFSAQNGILVVVFNIRIRLVAVF